MLGCSKIRVRVWPLSTPNNSQDCEKEANHLPCLAPKISLNHLSHHLHSSWPDRMELAQPIVGILVIFCQTYLETPEENSLLHPWLSGVFIYSSRLISWRRKSVSIILHYNCLQQRHKWLWFAPEYLLTALRGLTSWWSLGVELEPGMLFFSVEAAGNSHYTSISVSISLNMRNKGETIFHEYQSALSICWGWAG